MKTPKKKYKYMITGKTKKGKIYQDFLKNMNQVRGFKDVAKRFGHINVRVKKLY